MKKVIIISPLKGVVVNPPNGAYHEEFIVGRYTVKALLFPGGGYSFYVFRGDELKAIISNDDWFVSRLDGEGQNLLNRLLKIYG